MGQEREPISRRELIKGVSGAALGAHTVAQTPAARPILQRKQGWPDHKQAAVQAVRLAVNQWKLQARFADIRINAVTAMGGKLIGPDLTPFILAGMTAAPPNIAAAFARTVGSAWKQWADSVTVPGLPWYPAFAAFPAPMAPPTPNVPSPLAALVSTGDAAFLPPILTARLKQELGAAAAEAGAEREINDFALWLASNFAVWKASAQVMLVMGKGPVPTFAPPYVPVGPVVNGDIISTPGHLAAAPGFVLPSLNYLDPRSSFQSSVAGAYDVNLVNGAAALEGSSAHLFGDVSVTPAGSSAVKVLIRGAEMTLSQAASRGLLQQARLKLGSIQQQAAADGRITSVERIKVSEQAKILDTALAQTAGMNGSGRLEIQVGPHALVIPGAQFEVDSRGRIAILGGAVEVKGITHMVGRGSYISPTEVKLVGWIPLANYAISNSTLTFRPSGITGSGRLQAFAHAFSLRYDLSGPRLRAAAETGGPDRGWQSIPFANGAQFQSTGARIRLQVDGPNVAATVRIPTLGIRTAAARPDGKPWVESSSSAVTATIAVNGDVIVTPPGLANPGDPFRAAREACEAAARAAHVIPDVSSLLVGEAKRLAEEARDRAIAALNAALAECRAKNPPPPNSPTLPPRMTVKVGNLVG